MVSIRAVALRTLLSIATVLSVPEVTHAYPTVHSSVRDQAAAHRSTLQKSVTRTQYMNAHNVAAVHPHSTDRSRRRHKREQTTAPSVATMVSLAPVMDVVAKAGSISVKSTYDCQLTAYGPGFESTGKHPGDPGYGITATGKRAKPRHTIAVDPHLIPLGSLVYIDGVGYRVAEDVGGAIKGKHIDVFFSSDEDARIFGVKHHVKVYVFETAHSDDMAP